MYTVCKEKQSELLSSENGRARWVYRTEKGHSLLNAEEMDLHQQTFGFLIEGESGEYKSSHIFFGL